MRHTDYRYMSDHQMNNLMEDFSTWSEELVALLEQRVFGGQFRAIMQFVMSFEDDIVSRLTEEELDEQLTFCSQYKFTFSQLRDELGIYLSRIEGRYKTWMARKHIEARTKIFRDQSKLFEDGKITKSNVSTTKEDILNQVLVDNESENFLWTDFIEQVTRAKKLVGNIASDLEGRSIILMSLRVFVRSV